ncbi:MAG: PAS domain S-box protein [Elusimicrobiota bacterium]
MNRVIEAEFRALFDRAPISVLLIDSASALPVAFNDMACAQLGYAREEFARLRITDYEAEESLAQTGAHIEKVLREGRDEFRTRHRTKSGDIRNVLVTAWTISLPGRAFFNCIFRDVTEFEKVERHVRALASIIEAAPEAIVITGRNGVIQYVNRTWEIDTGYEAGDVVGKTTPRVLKSGRTDRATYERLWNAVARGESFKSELVNRRKDGSFYEVEIIIAPLVDAGGRATGYFGIERDITERRLAADALRRAEEQLRQSQKMEAVGRLAGGVAHDFNNLLTAISGYSELLLDSLESADPRRADVEEIKMAGARAAALTRQLLTFSRKQVLQVRAVDLKAVSEGIRKMLERLIGEDVALTMVHCKEPARVMSDPGHIEQVLVNLVVNARDAMPKGGRISIEIARGRFDDAVEHRHGTVKPGDYAVLTVTDTGHGMNEEVQSHLFEPFFTTKERGKGTGLGLSTVYGIVTQSGGHVTVFSEVGGGTSFKVYLPLLAKEEPGGDALVAAPTRTFEGTATILLVEDDKLVRDLACRILVQDGFKVLEADSGEAALLICSRQEAPIHLMLTDMVMPRMSGPELAQKISALTPQTRVVFMSGYTDHAVLVQGRFEAGKAFIQKPFSPAVLVQRIREELAGVR